MTLQVYSIDDIPRDEWSILTEGSFFSSPGFTSLWGEFGGKPVFLIMEHQGKLQAGMAAVTYGPRYLRRLKSMPEGLYGGPFYASAGDAGIREEFESALQKYIQTKNYIRADIFNPPAATTLPGFECRQTFTHLLKIDDCSYEIPNRRMRDYIRHAKKEGLKIIPFDDEKYLNDFYRLVLITDSRHNLKPRYSKDFFGKLLRLSKTDPRVILLLAVHNDKFLASHIHFIERGQIVNWKAYVDIQTPLRANYVLYDYLINLAISKGIKVINFGGSPPSAQNLISFKERWGTKKEDYPYYTSIMGLGEIIYRFRGR